MIFNLYGRVKLRLGDEEHIFDSSRLMFTEVTEIEKVTGQSFGEWQRELSRYSITAVAALLHVLRKRDDMPSDFATMQFNSAELDVIPLHEDGSEFTPQEVADDLAKRVKAAVDAKSVPTGAAGGAAPDPGPEPATTPGTSPSSPPTTTSAPGNGDDSAGASLRSSASAPTAS